jgi:hypothetical protein
LWTNNCVRIIIPPTPLIAKMISPELSISPRVFQTCGRVRYPTLTRGLISSGPTDWGPLDVALERPLLGQRLQADLAQDLQGSVHAYLPQVVVTHHRLPASVAMDTRPQWVVAQSQQRAVLAEEARPRQRAPRAMETLRENPWPGGRRDRNHEKESRQAA